MVVQLEWGWYIDGHGLASQAATIAIWGPTWAAALVLARRDECVIAELAGLLPISTPLPCGNRLEIRRLGDLPLTNEQCGCDRVAYPHFFVFWEGLCQS